MIDAPAIIGGYTTDDVRRRLDQCAKASRYHVAEWLIPQGEGDTLGLRVIAARKIKGREYERGFLWDGDDLNILATRCMALDMVMSQMPAMHARGELIEQVKEAAMRRAH